MIIRSVNSTKIINNGNFVSLISCSNLFQVTGTCWLIFDIHVLICCCFFFNINYVDGMEKMIKLFFNMVLAQ